MQKAQQHDGQDATRPAIDQQVCTIGATWLDKQLVGDGKDLEPQGFGAQVREAMHSRVDFLAGQDFTQRRGQRVILA